MTIMVTSGPMTVGITMPAPGPLTAGASDGSTEFALTIQLLIGSLPGFDDDVPQPAETPVWAEDGPPIDGPDA